MLGGVWRVNDVLHFALKLGGPPLYFFPVGDADGGGPMNIVNLFKAPLKRVDDKPNYRGGVARLSRDFGAKKLGFHIEVIDPGNFSCPYHFHTAEEELFIVLEGEAILRVKDQFYKVGPGDLFFYPTGPEFVHNIYNHTQKPFKFFAISNDEPDTDICFYPDSKKNTSPDGIVQAGVKVDYYKDEEDPAKYWPAHALRGEL